MQHQPNTSTTAISQASSKILADYRRLWLKRLILLSLLFILTIISFLIDVSFGPADISVRNVWQVLLSGDWANPSITTEVIVLYNRLPIACMALIVGIALALSGAEMQTILNNPLASPFTLGVSAAAALGAAVTIVFGLGVSWFSQSYLITFNAFLFAFGSILLLQYLTRGSRNSVEKVILFGIALGFTFNALIGMLQYAASADALQQLIFWGLGSLSRATWSNVLILTLVVVLIVPFSIASCWHMTALRLGEERAQSFGINVKRLRFFSLFRISLLAATAVAFVGTIAFIGLVAPNIARLLVGEDHRFFLPASALTGALVMSAASIASKLIIPGVILPVGIVTAFIGLPAFFSLIYKRSY